MIFWYVLLSVYILSVNFCSFLIVTRQFEEWESGDPTARKTDGKLILAALLGGAGTIYATMFALKYRLSNLLLMIFLPVLTVLNIYCFFLGFRGIYMFF